MTSESIKLYKLIILYFLNNTKQDISNAILSDFILEHGYTDYFSIQETLKTLTEDDMILVQQTSGTSYYSITDKGREILSFFGSQLPKDTMQQIDDYLLQNRIQIAKDNSIRTDYTQTAPNEYLIRCTLLERGSTLAEVALNLPTEKDAIKACRRFKEKGDIIYSFLFKELTTD